MFQSQNDILNVALTPIITLLKSDKMTYQHLESLILSLK